LDERGARGEQDLLHPLVLDPLAMDRLDPEEPPVLVDGRLEVRHRYPDVVQLGERDHRVPPGTGCIRAISSRASTT
jgi:hypothetical protein